MEPSTITCGPLVVKFDPYPLGHGDSRHCTQLANPEILRAAPTVQAASLHLGPGKAEGFKSCRHFASN